MNLLNLKNNRFLCNTLLALLAALLLALPFMVFQCYPIFVAIIPLLFIERSGVNKKQQFLYYFLTMIVWHLLAALWIAKAAAIGVYASTALNTFLWSIPLLTYSWVRRNISQKVGYYILIFGITGAEYFNIINGEVSWPWLLLGNAFANNTNFIQWYEYTGVLGGTLMVVVVNILIFQSMTTKKRQWVFALLIVSISLALSLILKSRVVNQVDAERVNVAIIQPNFDPYADKFTMSGVSQIKIIESILDSVPSDIDYIVMPETVINEEFEEQYINNNGSINYLKNILATKFKNADLIMGAMTYTMYRDAKTAPTITARYLGGDTYYDMSNSSLSVNPNREVDIYRKTKLVIGAEMLPFHTLLAQLGDLSVKLGGTSGVLKPEGSPILFKHSNIGVNSGAAICYESLYGDYYADFSKIGAELMFVVTNDGWWDETLGYKQHFNYSKLRAIETRREIARAANTGISAFISPTGEVEQSLGWWKRGCLIGEVQLSNRVTFYANYGDYLGAISLSIFILITLFSIATSYRSKLLM